MLEILLLKKDKNVKAKFLLISKVFSLFDVQSRCSKESSLLKSNVSRLFKAQFRYFSEVVLTNI